MKDALNWGLGALPGMAAEMRVLPSVVRNIRNIEEMKEKNQSEQGVTRKEAFRIGRNNLERNGTELFLTVPEMFRFHEVGENGCSLSATRLPEVFRKKLFRFVPVVPEQLDCAGGRGFRGLQIFAGAMFRMFRTFRGGARNVCRKGPIHA